MALFLLETTNQDSCSGLQTLSKWTNYLLWTSVKVVALIWLAFQDSNKCSCLLFVLSHWYCSERRNNKNLEISKLPLQPCSHFPRAHFLSIHLTSLYFFNPVFPRGSGLWHRLSWENWSWTSNTTHSKMFHQGKGGKCKALQIILRQHEPSFSSAIHSHQKLSWGKSQFTKSFKINV